VARELGIGIDVDIDELVTAIKTVDEAARLFEEALAAYQARGLRRTNEDYKVAGGPVQTLQGAEEMARGTRKVLAELALAAGFTVGGLPEQADRRLATARNGLPGISGGGSRMARPLLDPTLEGLRLLLSVELFEPAFRAGIEAVIGAEKATYPDPAMFRVS
jgi:hypothetical protein